MKILSILFLFIMSISISANANYKTQNQVKTPANTQLKAQEAVYKSIYKINQFSGSKYPPQVMRKFIQSEILPLFDFDYMSSSVLRNAPKNFNQKQFILKVKNDIADTIINALFKARGRAFIPVGIKKINNSLIVKVRVKNIVIDLALHNTNAGWKIFDIVMQNQSLIKYYQNLVSR